MKIYLWANPMGMLCLQKVCSIGITCFMAVTNVTVQMSTVWLPQVASSQIYALMD